MPTLQNSRSDANLWWDWVFYFYFLFSSWKMVNHPPQKGSVKTYTFKFFLQNVVVNPVKRPGEVCIYYVHLVPLLQDIKQSLLKFQQVGDCRFAFRETMLLWYN